jgi:phage shock protein PspC (stress-responsive transcriptional regulator)
MNTTETQSGAATAAGPEAEHAGPRPLCRPLADRMLAGVASGLARYLGIDVLLARIALVVLCFVGGIGVPLYVAGWLLIPDEGTGQSIAADFIRSTRDGRI